MISAPPMDATSNGLTDWLELEVFASNQGRGALIAVNENIEIDEDFEPEELDEQNRLAERRVQQVATAVEERCRTMRDAYPFEVDAKGRILSLKEPISEAGCAYLFCLIVSNGAKGGLLAGDGPWAPNLVMARGLFHICATVSAAGFVEGPAFCTGSPRFDSTGFLEKLATVYQCIGDGVVHTKMPPGAPVHVQDSDVDVIAWKPPVIGLAGAMYFLWQAATGANWGEKSLKGTPDVFHGTWFAKPPASQVQVGTIIPFLLPTDADAEGHRNQEAIVAGRLDYEIRKHGHVLWRHLVARFVARALEIHPVNAGPIERIEDLSKLCDYVEAYRAQLQTAIADPR